MAVTTIEGTTTDDEVSILALDGSATSTEIRLQGAIKNTGANPMQVMIASTNFFGDEAAAGFLLAPGLSLAISTDEQFIGTVPPVEKFSMTVVSANTGASTTYDLLFTSW
jgi:hypothetical protein